MDRCQPFRSLRRIFISGRTYFFPGLIKLTPSTLYFTPLAASHPRLANASWPGSVRKLGLEAWRMRGREEKFYWTGVRHRGFAFGWFPVLVKLLKRFSPKLALAMFFSPDLLSRRDSGFGLLWLAATLGSKSAFKKLPKRSVMTADISQLCRLIATPAEPLALRLSSNLLVGAARVYRVKQEIFMSDVTTCFNSLKRVEHEFQSLTSSEGQFQMAQPSVKSSAVTLRADPKAVFSAEFDAMIMNWDEYLNLGSNMDVKDDSDNDYHPTTMKGKGKTTASSALAAKSDLLRATACTLPDNHDFLLANSFDASFGGSGTTRLSSSQIGGFGYDDTFDGLDIEEGVGDDLVRELGEGWGFSPVESNNFAQNLPQVQEQLDFDIHFGVEDFDDGRARFDSLVQVAQSPRPHVPTKLIDGSHMESAQSASCSLAGKTESVDLQTIAHAPGSPIEFTIQHVYKAPIQPEHNGTTLKPAKRTRPVLDVRTELTDDELKATRLCYLEKQNAIRYGLEFKRFEKNQDGLIHSLLWDAPGSVHAKELIDFWVDHFKAHVESRSGLFGEPQRDGAPRQKRRKVSIPPPQSYSGDKEDIPVPAAEDWRPDQAINGGHMNDFDYNMDVNWGDIDDYISHAKNLRSSEEPGQARRTSHPPPSFEANLGVDVVSTTFQSQHSALFPWDMAGNSSSVPAREVGLRLPSHDQMSIEHADARLRGSSTSRRGSSIPSLPNIQAGIASPAMILSAIRSDDDFVFDVPGDDHALESHQLEANRVALEKNSYNFLEYAKMQYRSLPSTQYLGFDDVVPKTTSTARVAAAALYHCLVLATKNLLYVNQEEPYGRINIRIA